LAEILGQSLLQSDLSAHTRDARYPRDRSRHTRLRRINGAARVGAHRTSMLQDLERGRPLELDAMLTSVQELGRLVKLDTPHIDAVLALTQQLGRTMGLYPTFPEEVSQREVDEARVD